MRMYDMLFISFKNIKNNKKRLLFPIISLSLFILIMHISVVYLLSLKEGISKNISSNQALKFIEIENKAEQKDFTPKDISEIEKIKGVKCIFPRATVKVETNNYLGKRVNLMLLGIPDAAAQEFLNQNQAFESSKDIYISKEYKDNFKGEQLDLNLVAADKNSNAIEVHISGEYNNMHILDLEKGISLAPMTLVNSINAKYAGLSEEEYLSSNKFIKYIIIVNDLSKVEAIAKQLDSKGYSTYYQLKAMKELPAISRFILIIGLVLGVFIGFVAIITTNLTVKEIFYSRKRYMGIMLSMGYSNKNILQLLLAELFFIALISYALSSGLILIMMPIFNFFIATISFKIYIEILICSFPLILFMVILSGLKAAINLSNENVIKLLKTIGE